MNNPANEFVPDEHAPPPEEIEKSWIAADNERRMQQDGYVMKEIDGKIVVDFVEGDSVTFGDVDPGNGLDGHDPRELTGRPPHTPTGNAPTVIEYTARDVADNALALLDEYWHGEDKPYKTSPHDITLSWRTALREQPKRAVGAIDYTHKWMLADAKFNRHELAVSQGRRIDLKFPTKDEVIGHVRQVAKPAQMSVAEKQRRQQQVAKQNQRTTGLAR